MPALSRSFQSVSLNPLSNSPFRGSWLEALKSGTAMRILSTPSPVPVLIQSWAGALIAAKTATSKNTEILRTMGRIEGMVVRLNSVLKQHLCIIWFRSSLEVEPELDTDFASGIVRRQRPERINPLQRTNRRYVERRHPARLLDFDVRCPATAVYIGCH